jgi:hypothetical protein
MGFLAESMADSMVHSVKAPWHVWVVGAVSLIWNSVGAMDFVMTQTRNKAYMSGFTPAQLDFYYGFPVWVVAVWGIAVWGGVLGSLLLLMRRRQAFHLFLSSSVCMVLADIYNFGAANSLKLMGGAAAVAFSAVIFVIGLLLLVYARTLRKRRVLT